MQFPQLTHTHTNTQAFRHKDLSMPTFTPIGVTHTHTHSNSAGTRRGRLWLMHEARGPAVKGVCVLITLSVCFISSWCSLMNDPARDVSPAMLSPNRLRRCDRSHPSLTTPPQIGRCVCQVVKRYDAHEHSLLLNSLTYIWRIIQAAVAGHMRFDCWTLSHSWDLVQGDGHCSLITHADGLWCFWCVLLQVYITSSHLGMLNLNCTLNLLHLLYVIYCKSLQIK